MCVWAPKKKKKSLKTRYDNYHVGTPYYYKRSKLDLVDLRWVISTSSQVDYN